MVGFFDQELRQRVAALEAENAKLKNPLVESTLDVEVVRAALRGKY